MKTKTIAVSLMLTFTSCALFAQSTDTIPTKTDTTKKDTVALLSNARMNATLKNISKENAEIVNGQTVYALPAKAVKASQPKTALVAAK